MMDKMSYYINIFDITYDNSYLSMINCTYIISKNVLFINPLFYQN